MPLPFRMQMKFRSQRENLQSVPELAGETRHQNSNPRTGPAIGKVAGAASAWLNQPLQDQGVLQSLTAAENGQAKRGAVLEKQPVQLQPGDFPHLSAIDGNNLIILLDAFFCGG